MGETTVRGRSVRTSLKKRKRQRNFAPRPKYWRPSSQVHRCRVSSGEQRDRSSISCGTEPWRRRAPRKPSDRWQRGARVRRSSAPNGAAERPFGRRRSAARRLGRSRPAARPAPLARPRPGEPLPGRRHAQPMDAAVPHRRPARAGRQRDPRRLERGRVLGRRHAQRLADRPEGPPLAELLRGRAPARGGKWIWLPLRSR